MIARAVLLAVALLGGLGGCGSPSSPARIAGAEPGVVASNVARADYAGSQACSDCHGEIYAAWQHSPMKNMTRDAATAEIRAPFDGATLRVGTDTCTMEMRGASRTMKVTTAKGTTTWRVTKVVGGRYREDFVGVDDSGIGVERVLPATYVFATKSWRYKGYSVMVKERPGLSTRAVWANECIACHNTLPLATMLYDELYGDGLPSYQGKLSDRVLPPRLTWGAASRDDRGLARLLADEIRFLGGEPPASSSLRASLPAAAVASAQHLDGAHLVELGVGCEACHNGSRAHVAQPAQKPAFAVQSALLAVTPPPGQRGTPAQQINHTCAKCHTVLFTRYPWTWEGGARAKNPGGSTTNSGEGRDFQLGGCASQMACTSCHDPHAADAPDKLAHLDHVCEGCHQNKATPAHSHHTNVSCVDCHMPRKNMGLGYGLVRYHRIGSPTDPARVLGDRPLECALCHADKSVESLVTTMETWFGKHYARAPLRALYGNDLGVNAIRATLVRGKPHEQAVAIATLGEAKDRSTVPHLAPQLAHDYPLVRYFAQRALQTLTGDPVALDLGAPQAELRVQAQRWLDAQRVAP